MQMDRNVVLRELVRLRMAFPESGYDEEGLIAVADIWLEVLPDMQEEGFKSSVAQCLNKCRFFPKPADMIEAYESWCRTQRVDRAALPKARYTLSDEKRQEVSFKCQRILKMIRSKRCIN
ncbi:MAG: hypothetical protein ACNI27_08550 [Desulfovibrio sp.]